MVWRQGLHARRRLHPLSKGEIGCCQRRRDGNSLIGPEIGVERFSLTYPVALVGNQIYQLIYLRQNAVPHQTNYCNRDETDKQCEEATNIQGNPI